MSINNKPIKVLAIVPDFVEKPSGGLGEQFRQIRNNLQNKVEYYICGYPEKNSIKNYRSAHAPIPDFPHQALTTIYGQSIYFLESLSFNVDFDIIHAFDWSSFYAGVLAARHFKKPLVCTVQLSLSQLNKAGIYYCHDFNSVDGKYINDLQIKFEEFGLQNADKIIHVSNYYKSFYDHNESFSNKSAVIENGINLKEWRKKNTLTLPGKNKLKICYIGRASVMKGLNTILNCNIPDDVDFYFIVSEKNAEEPFFSQIRQKANNKNIFHVNGLYGQDKVDFLFQMDAVVMPSLHEPFGIVALEALISKNVLITTATGGIGEILTDTPFLKIDNPTDLEKKIDFLKKCPKNIKEEMIQKGENRARQFDWKIQSNKVLDVYESLAIKN
jgi:glycosyltransferase involved in cell wall biosynthesis